MKQDFLTNIYFYIHNNFKPSIRKISAMGIIAFSKSLYKHIKRGSISSELKKEQIQGILMCFKQLIIGK